MKVLITGGYGFIGSHVADRFQKEGYDVFIIDNMSSGRKENISFKHKSYALDVENSKCEEVFRANKFDVIIHLAAQVSVTASISNPRLDSESNVLGLVNMLNLSKKYNVKKFIYASSAAVYGMKAELPIVESADCSPISPYGISKWVGESYSQKWQQLYGLETIGFRFSNVYGPRQDALGEGGVISIFMNRLLNEQSLIIHGDGNQTRDFIYVEDVADAIYRSSYSQLCGVYNLSTNTECTVNEVVEVMGTFQQLKPIAFSDKRSGDIDRSSLSNEKIKRDLDWSPMYSIEEGLKRTYAYFSTHRSQQESAAATSNGPSTLRLALRRVMPYGENMLAFALTAWLTIGQQYASYGVIDIKLFYITIMGILYGNRQSILAVIMSIGLFVYQKLDDGREFISLLYDTDVFFQIAIYLFIGLVVGYSIERKNAQIQDNEQKNEELESKYDFLSSVYQEVREVKDELQLRILNSGDSYGKIYSITKELESLEPENIFTSTVHVVKSVMSVPNVSIYTVSRSGSYLRLVAQSSNNTNQMAKSLKVDEHPYLTLVMSEGKMYVNKQLAEGIPLMCAPIYYRNEIAAVVAIDGLSFEKFSLYHQNLFKITVDLVSSALSKAFAYIEATEGQRYVDGTPILQREAFETVLSSKKQAWEKNQTPYLLLKGNARNISLEEIGNKISNMLRETDYTGLDIDQNIMVLLSNTNKEDASHVLGRFAQRGITLSVVQEGI
ncbi:NAD-dependent epimerase/dehydratase family protein [Paenibacillus sp. L3-i20]|uniref:NAD-dependent epimerase/dehydratase family protein n=1 Tax=Paenibacillus sp. L3-i20 TaxID=2905833 RepID=UPI001EDD5C3F|nr:NAD-dependent epimerase/dehydratase family protein [Paenibacillus sp. L3-i20]GKU77077.1 nucleoside-diphosphate sugar epimerase [Paenibacillus sp. L3-i20]